MFHRSYDLSCVQDIHEMTLIQTAINGVNLACSDMVDAWLYVERGSLLEDSHRTLGDHDIIPKTIFTTMDIDNHSGNSFSLTLSTLQTIAQDYEGWRLAREQFNSIIEGSTNFWNSWRNMKLTPYYRSVSGGGSVVSIGPILEDFLNLKASRNEPYSEDRQKIENELMNHLAHDIEDKIYILEQIVSLEPSPHCSELLELFKKRLAHKKMMERNDEILVEDALRQLSAAIDTRNPIALNSALNPGWYSVKFQCSDLYKRATSLMSSLN
jgi:hypothetical protein